MIFGVAVDLPEIVKLRVGQNIFHAQHRGHHGVVLIVVFVHAVAADQVQVRTTGLQFLSNDSNVLCVIVIVNRIRFFLTHDATIDEIAFLGETDLNQFAPCEVDQLAVARIPKTVVFETEIFETVTDLVRIGHHLRRPGTEVLDTADLYAWVVNVDPVVIKHVAIFQDQHHRDKVAIFEAFGRALRSLIHRRRQTTNQFPHRRR